MRNCENKEDILMSKKIRKMIVLATKKTSV